MSNRNEIIFERHSNGESATALAREYGVDRVRIYQIVKKEKEKRALNNNPLYVAIYKAAEEIGCPDVRPFAGRVFTRLRLNKVTTIEELKELDLDAWKECRNVGSSHIEVVKKILANV